jgi:hypothetical protein
MAAAESAGLGNTHMTARVGQILLWASVILAAGWIAFGVAMGYQNLRVVFTTSGTLVLIGFGVRLALNQQSAR